MQVDVKVFRLSYYPTLWKARLAIMEDYVIDKGDMVIRHPYVLMSIIGIYAHERFE